MTETLEQQIVHLQIEDIHEAAGASFCLDHGWRVPASYGDESSEYAAVREGIGLIDLSSRGRVRVSGSEAIMFLNGLITNDMKTLAQNHWMPALFPTVQGRLIAATRVIRLRDDSGSKNPSAVFLLDTEPATHERLLKTIGRFTLAGDFRVSDLTTSTAMFSLQGPRAVDAVRTLFADSVANLSRDGAVELDWNETVLTVMRATHSSEDGFDLFIDSAHARSLWASLTEAGAQPIGHNVLKILRIEAGIPSYGADMDETNVVTELNLDDAVSYTKGCYVGQEIIVRIKHRGHVAKKLVGMVLEGDEGVKSGASVQSIEGKEIGRVTSTAWSPKLGKFIALGYLRYEYLAPKTTVKVKSETVETEATVSSLPLVRGSWW